MTATRVSVEVRISRRVLIVDLGHSTPCHIWQGAKTKDGYGSVKVDGAVLYTHRVMYALFVGDLIPGMHVDHVCRNRACCNPEHLEQVTPEENTRRGDAAILSVVTVAAIKARAFDGEPIAAIAREFDVSSTAIRNIRDGVTWIDVAPAFDVGFAVA